MASIFVTDQFPEPNATGVFINDVIYVQFSEPVDASTVTYYNFTVNERHSFQPVDGTIELQSISGTFSDSLAIFVPDNGLKRNFKYTVLVTTGVKSKVGERFLDHDHSWFFETGNVAASGTIGDAEFDLDPSGFTASGVVSSGPTTSGNISLEVISTSPADCATNISRSIPNICITFNDIIPSGIDLYDHITLTPRGVLG